MRRARDRLFAALFALLVLGGCAGCGDGSEGAGDDSAGVQAEPRFATFPSGTDVALCRRAMIGSGPDDWRQTSVVAGPLAVRSRPFLLAGEVRPGEFGTKMPALVTGHREVMLEVPERLRDRVGLFFSRENNLITHGTGATGVRFVPCTDRPRTIWPGGILVAGHDPVWLRVTEKGRPPDVLWLGRVKPPGEY